MSLLRLAHSHYCAACDLRWPCHEKACTRHDVHPCNQERVQTARDLADALARAVLDGTTDVETVVLLARQYQAAVDRR